MRLGWHWENTRNHTCMAGAWRRQCLTVMATNKLGRLATADILEERGNGASDIHKGHSKGIRKWSRILLEGITKWVIAMGGRLVRTIWMFKSISKRILTSSTPTKLVLPHFRKLYPTYLENQDQDLKVNLFLLLISYVESISNPLISLQNISQIHLLPYLHRYLHIKPPPFLWRICSGFLTTLSASALNPLSFILHPPTVKVILYKQIWSHHSHFKTLQWLSISSR